MSNDKQAGAELLPCPFCGGTETFVERLSYSAAYVQCDSSVNEYDTCGARSPIGVAEDDDQNFPGEAAAIRAWNEQAARSAPAPSQSAPLDDLETYPSPHGTLIRLADAKCRFAALARAPLPAQADLESRQQVAEALGLGRNDKASFAWTYLLSAIKELAAPAQADDARMDCGHGHVYPHPSGMKARCGGPGMCKLCSRDLAAKKIAASLAGKDKP
jgi:hypothetical protein